MVVSIWRILHHVVPTLTMTKIQIISAKIENNVLLLAMYINFYGTCSHVYGVPVSLWLV